jgi:hypothetical protein
LKKRYFIYIDLQPQTPGILCFFNCTILKKMKMKIIILGLAFVCVSGSTLMAQNTGRIKSAWKNSYLNMETETIQATPITGDLSSAQWELIEVQAGQFKIKNVAKGTFLNIENGALKCTAIKDGWLSARWAVTKVSGSNAIRINSIWKPALFINIETGSPACSAIKDGWLSARWYWDGTNTIFNPNKQPAIKPATNPSNNSINIQEVLDAHNKLRLEVGVPPLTWSAELAGKAQAWANELAKKNRGDEWVMEHSQTPGIGENIAGGNVGFDTPSGSILSLWGGEKKNFDPSTRKCISGTECGHYTQVVWRNTTQVGCAVTANPNGKFILVCNYNPSGNFNNEPAF